MGEFGTTPGVSPSNKVRLAALEARATATEAALSALTAQFNAKKFAVALPDVTIAAAGLITLTAGEKTFSNLDCAGLLTTDQIIVSPKSLAAGYGLRSWSIPSNGKLNILVQCPVLAVGGSALVFAVTAFR